jgi:hypothetical protein
VFGFFGRLAEATGGTFYAVGLPRNKSIAVPVANVTHMRDGKVIEFWGTTSDAEASADSGPDRVFEASREALTTPIRAWR